MKEYLRTMVYKEYFYSARTNDFLHGCQSGRVIVSQFQTIYYLPVWMLATKCVCISCTKRFMRIRHDSFLVCSPGIFVNVGVKVVVPSFSTLFAGPAFDIVVTHDVFGDDAPRARPIPHYQVFDSTVLLLAPDAPITRRHLRLITRVGASRTGKRAVIHRGQQ